MAKKLINNFNGGELSPFLYGRADFPKYNTGCIKMENFIPLSYGGATKRPGTRFLTETKNGNACRLIPFTVDADNTYLLEFTTGILRIFKNNNLLSDADDNVIELVTPYQYNDLSSLDFVQSLDVMFLAQTNHPLKELKRISIEGGVEKWSFDDFEFVVPPLQTENINSSNTLQISHQTTNPAGYYLNASTDFDPFSTNIQDDLNQYYQLKEQRVNDTSRSTAGQVGWNANIFSSDVFAEANNTNGWEVPDTQTAISPWMNVSFINWNIDANCKNVSVVVQILDRTKDVFNAVDADWQDYHIVADNRGGLASVIKLFTFATTEPEQANTFIRVKVTKDAAFVTEDCVFTLLPDSSQVISLVQLASDSEATTSKRLINILSPPQGIKADGLLYWESVITDRWAAGAFSFASGFPVSIAFYENRLVLGGTFLQTNTLWLSKTNDYSNFTIGNLDTDALSLTLNSTVNNEIKWLIPADTLVIGTTSSEWTLGSDSDQLPITPTSFSLKERSTFGTNDVKGQFIKNSILFLSLSGRKLREWNFNYFTLESETPDLTLLSEHITKTGIREISYQREPDSILWMIKNDGTLIGLTYDKQQNVFAWHRHKFGSLTTAEINFITNYNQQIRLRNYVPGSEGDVEQRKIFQSIHKDFSLNFQFNLKNNQQVPSLSPVTDPSDSRFTMSLKRCWNPILFCSASHPEAANAITLQVADDRKGLELQVAGRTQQGIHFRGQGDKIELPTFTTNASTATGLASCRCDIELAYDHYRSTTAPDTNLFDNGTDNPLVTGGQPFKLSGINNLIFQLDNVSIHHRNSRWQIRPANTNLQPQVTYGMDPRGDRETKYGFVNTKQYNKYSVEFVPTSTDGTVTQGTYKYYINDVLFASTTGKMNNTNEYIYARLGSMTNIRAHLSHFSGSVKSLKYTNLPGVSGEENIIYDFDFTTLTSNTVTNAGTGGDATVKTVTGTGNENYYLTYSTTELPKGFQDFRDRNRIAYETLNTFTANKTLPFYAKYITNMIDETDHSLKIDFLPSQSKVVITKDNSDIEEIPFRWTPNSRVRTQSVDAYLFSMSEAASFNHTYQEYDSYTPNGELIGFQINNHPYITPNINSSVTGASDTIYEPYMDITAKSYDFLQGNPTSAGQHFGTYTGGNPDRIQIQAIETLNNQRRIGSNFNTALASPADAYPNTTGNQGKAGWNGWAQHFYGYPTGTANNRNPNNVNAYPWRNKSTGQPTLIANYGAPEEFTMNIEKVEVIDAGVANEIYNVYVLKSLYQEWYNTIYEPNGSIIANARINNVTFTGTPSTSILDVDIGWLVTDEAIGAEDYIKFVFNDLSSIYGYSAQTVTTVSEVPAEDRDVFRQGSADIGNEDSFLSITPLYLDYEFLDFFHSTEAIVYNKAGFMVKGDIFTDQNGGTSVPSLTQNRIILDLQSFVKTTTRTLRLNSVASLPSVNNDDILYASISIGETHHIVKFDSKEFGNNYKLDYNGLDSYNRQVVSESVTSLSGFTHLIGANDLGVMVNGQTALATANDITITRLEQTIVGETTRLVFTTAEPIDVTSFVLLKNIFIPTGLIDINTNFAYSFPAFHGGNHILLQPNNTQFLLILINQKDATEYKITSSKVNANGALNFANELNAGDVVVVGLHYNSTLAPMFIQSPELPGEKIAGFKGEVLFKDTVSAKIGQTEEDLSVVLFDKNVSADNQKSDVAEFYISNENKYLQTVFIVEDGNQPCTVLSSVLDVEV